MTFRVPDALDRSNTTGRPYPGGLVASYLSRSPKLQQIALGSGGALKGGKL